jgi:hypothetical protein
MESIENILSFEVKKEIAERYFGFRKIIEEDSMAYLEKAQDTSVMLEHGIGCELVRIYSLLHRESLIEEFIELTHLPERFFFEDFMTTLPGKEQLFSGRQIRGFTRKGCLHNMFFDAYIQLYNHVLEYREVYLKLVESHETICAQIQLFYRKNDIHTILHFLRGLEGGSAQHVSVSFNSESRDELERKMRIYPPPPVTELLPDVPAIPAEKSIRKELKNLVVKACLQQPLLDLRGLKSKRS